MKRIIAKRVHTPQSMFIQGTQWWVAIFILMLTGILVWLIITFWLPSRRSIDRIEPSPTPISSVTESASINNGAWTTYQNEKYSFQMKHPANADVIERFNLDFGTVPGMVSNTVDGIAFSTAEQSPHRFYTISLTIFSLTPETDLKQWITESVPILGEPKPYKVGPYSGFAVEVGQEGVFYAVYLPIKDKIFHFNLSGGDAGSSYTDIPEAMEIVNQMLSSLEVN